MRQRRRLYCDLSSTIFVIILPTYYDRIHARDWTHLPRWMIILIVYTDSTYLTTLPSNIKPLLRQGFKT